VYIVQCIKTAIILPDSFSWTRRGILQSSNNRGQNRTTNVGLDGPTSDITGLKHKENNVSKTALLYMLHTTASIQLYNWKANLCATKIFEHW